MASTPTPTAAAELVKDFAANTSAGKMNMSSALSEFKLSGDVRLRHQTETQAPETASGTPAVSNERSRERYRFRFNGDALLQKGWGAGFAFETASAADSGNQTFQDANNDYSLFLARAYVSYQMNSNLFFAAGKTRNPFYTTDLIWDADINPQGVGGHLSARLLPPSRAAKSFARLTISSSVRVPGGKARSKPMARKRCSTSGHGGLPTTRLPPT